MRSIKSFLKAIDVFGVPLSFRYKKKNYYSTSLGGLFIILLIIVVLIVGIYYFIPFMNRKNFSVIYYTMNLAKTEQIKFKESKAAFAYGLDCEKVVNNLTVDDVFKIESKFIVYTKKADGTFNKDKRTLTTHSCGYADFYNNYNNSVDFLNLGKFNCLDDNDHIIEGIFADQVFSYYEFGAVAKTGTEQNFKDIDNFLLYNDCKFQIYYTDITFDLVDYEEPIKPYLNTLFIQIDPTLFIKRNIYFMNQYLYNDNYLIFNFGDDVVPDQKTLFSRYEEYALHQGMDRMSTQPPDMNNYAKMYIRADTRRTEVQRKYQKLVEFYSDLSAVTITLFRLMIIFFNFANTFYAMHSVSKRMFFFKDIEKNHFNIFKKPKYIYDLMYMTESYSFDNNQKDSSETEKYPNGNRQLDAEEDKARENENVNIYKKNINNEKGNKPPTNIYNKTKKENQLKEKYNDKDLDYSVRSKILKSKNANISRVNSIYKRRDNLNENLNMKRNKRYNDMVPNQKSDYVEKINMNSSDRTERTDSEEAPKKKHHHKKIKYSFNIFEAILGSFCQCCLCKNLQRKNDINEKANDILFNKLDIVLYIRNMLLLDIMNETTLDEPKKNIINFLCRPVISLNKKNKNDKNNLQSYYKGYKYADLENLSISISYLSQKPNKDKEDKRLISLSHQQLKNML